MLACFDIGGTSIKCGFWENGEITHKESFFTPDNLDSMIVSMKGFIANETIDGVAISLPGVVHKDTGRVTGLSAVPYIHEIDLVKILEAEFGTRVSIENDANCAALCESEYGVARNTDSSAFIVIGTGIGGAFILNNQIIKGHNLLAGEYGMVRESNSNIGDYTLVNQAEKYNDKNKSDITGKRLIDESGNNNEDAEMLINEFVEKMGILVFNIQTTMDPEIVVIGGGVSHEIKIITRIKNYANDLLHNRGYKEIEIDVQPCKFQNDANLIGAVVSYDK